MSYGEVMNLPIRVFWLMNSNVGRLLAEKDIRAITVQSARHGGDQMLEVKKNLEVELGNTGKVKGDDGNQVDAVMDEEGYAELKALAALM